MTVAVGEQQQRVEVTRQAAHADRDDFVFLAREDEDVAIAVPADGAGDRLPNLNLDAGLPEVARSGVRQTRELAGRVRHTRARLRASVRRHHLAARYPMHMIRLLRLWVSVTVKVPVVVSRSSP